MPLEKKARFTHLVAALAIGAALLFKGGYFYWMRLAAPGAEGSLFLLRPADLWPPRGALAAIMASLIALFALLVASAALRRRLDALTAILAASFALLFLLSTPLLPGAVAFRYDPSAGWTDPIDGFVRVDGRVVVVREGHARLFLVPRTVATRVVRAAQDPLTPSELECRFICVLDPDAANGTGLCVTQPSHPPSFEFRTPLRAIRVAQCGPGEFQGYGLLDEAASLALQAFIDDVTRKTDDL